MGMEELKEYFREAFKALEDRSAGGVARAPLTCSFNETRQAFDVFVKELWSEVGTPSYRYTYLHFYSDMFSSCWGYDDVELFNIAWGSLLQVVEENKLKVL